MVSADDSNNTYSGFLALPTELRCQVYSYLIAESHAITISAGYITILGERIKDRARETDVPGLPLDLAPLVRRHHAAALLSVANPPSVAIGDGCIGEVEDGKLEHPASLALLQTCQLIKDELSDYIEGKRRIAQARSSQAETEDDKEGLSLYVSYPYGVLVLKHLYPFLLKQARRVYISGYYTGAEDKEASSPTSPEVNDAERLTPTSSFTDSFVIQAPVHTFNRRRHPRNHLTRTPSHSVLARIPTPRPRPRLRIDPPLQRRELHVSEISTVFPPFYPCTTTLALSALAQLVRTLFPRERTQTATLSARILYPGENTNPIIWSDKNSPASHILPYICEGKIDMLVKRGSLATGLCLTARPKPGERIVSTSWENWRGPIMGNVMRRQPGRLGVKDFDYFLVGEV